MEYLFAFISSMFFAFFADKFEKKNIVIYFFLILLVIFIPCYLAGARDTTVGYDTGEYVLNTFKIAKRYDNLNNFLKNSEDIEILFKLLCYLVSRFTESIFYLLFAIELIVMSSVVLIAKFFKKDAPLWLFLFVYFFLFYYQTLNIARQCLAIAFCLYAFKFVVKGKLVMFLLFVVIAMGFHSTAIIFLLVYPSYKYFEKKQISNKKFFILILLILFGNFILFLKFDQIIMGAVTLGLLSSKFLQYMSESERYESGGFSNSDLIFYSTVILFSLFTYKKKILGKVNIFFVVLSILILSLNLTSLISQWANRLYLYFAFLLIVFLPILFKRRFNGKKEWCFLFVLLILFFWYLVVIQNGGAGTYPYKSNSLGI